MLKEFNGSKIITALTLIVLSGTVLITIFLGKILPAHISVGAYFFIVAWLLLAVFSALFSFREFSAGYLLCAFTMMIAWRIAALYEVKLITYPLLVAFVLLVLNLYIAQPRI